MVVHVYIRPRALILNTSANSIHNRLTPVTLVAPHVLGSNTRASKFQADSLDRHG